MGMTLIVAPDLGIARDQLRANPVDVILAERFLPDGTAIDLLEEIRMSIVWNDIPLVILSADLSREFLAQCGGLGVENFISKPLDAPTLDAELSKILGQVPRRWEEEPESLRRLGMNRSQFENVLRLARDELVTIRRELDRPEALLGDTPGRLVLRVKSIALNVGAFRLGRLMDLVWSTSIHADDMHVVRVALDGGIQAFTNRVGDQGAPNGGGRASNLAFR